MKVSDFVYVNAAKVDRLMVLDKNDNLVDEVEFETKRLLADDIFEYGDQRIIIILQDDNTDNLVLMVRK